MRNIIMIFLLCFSVASQAQIKKGAIQLSTDISSSSTEEDNIAGPQKTTYSAYNFRAGYAFAENRVLGLSYNNVHSKGMLANNQSNSISAYYRRYYPLGKSRFLAFGEVGAGYLHTESSSPNSSTTSISKGVRAYLTPGISFQPLRWLQIEASVPSLISIGYTTQKQPMTPYKVTNVNFDMFSAGTTVGSLFAIGLSFNINNK